MPKIKVMKPIEPVRQISAQEVATQMGSEYVTKSDLTELFGQLKKQINPESALTPEVRSVVKAVEDVQGLRNALKDPTSRGIEEATSTLVTTVLGNALSNMTGAGQGVQAPPKSLLNTLAEIATHNITSNLPQVIESAKSALGQERLQKGYDMGLKYVENQQAGSDFINTVMSLDENNDEHINYYAQQMGYTNFDKARNALIEHKIVLYQEQQEYQEIQQGQTQQMNAETVVEEQIIDNSVNNNQVLNKQVLDNQVLNKQVLNEQVVNEVPTVMMAVEKQTIDESEVLIKEHNTNDVVENNTVSSKPLKVQINKKKFSNPPKIKVLDENIVDDEFDDKIDEIYDDLAT